MGLSHSPRIVTDGLVMCLDAGNSRSYPGTGTVWTDLAGNIGTLTNGPTFNSENGGSVVFDGTNDGVDVSGTESFNGPLGVSYTLSAWFYPTRTGAWQAVVCKNRSTNTYTALFLSDDNKFALGVSYGSHTLKSSATFTTNTWYNITILQRGSSSHEIYINGSLDIIRTGLSEHLASGSETFRLGEASGTSEYFQGRISNVLLYYNKALTADEIRQNYLATKERYA